MANYQVVDESQTDIEAFEYSLGDKLASIVIIPKDKTPGSVTLYDGNAAIEIFAGVGGSLSLDTVTPVVVPLGIKSKNGGWSVTTGNDVAVMLIKEG